MELKSKDCDYILNVGWVLENYNLDEVLCIIYVDN